MKLCTLLLKCILDMKLRMYIFPCNCIDKFSNLSQNIEKLYNIGMLYVSVLKDNVWF